MAQWRCSAVHRTYRVHGVQSKTDKGGDILVNPPFVAISLTTQVLSWHARFNDRQNNSNAVSSETRPRPRAIVNQRPQRLRANAGFSWRRVFPDSVDPPLADDMDVQALT